jgi:undecaprenyl-diphosphatase
VSPRGPRGSSGTGAFFLLGDLIDERAQLPLDAVAFDIAARLDAGIVRDIADRFTALASLPAVAIVVAATTVWAFARRRFHEAAVLPVALLLTWLAVVAAKAYFDRPRPSGALVATDSAAYPSAHAAYAAFYVACAIVLLRAGSGLAARFAIVSVAIVLAVALALSRVLLRASHLSDVEGGAGLATAILASLGVIAIAVAGLRHNGRPDP